MTVENTNSKQIAQQMGTLSEYPFSLTVLLTDPTEEDAKKAIKAKVKQADGVEIDLTYGTDYSVSLNTDRSGGIVSVTDKRTSDDYITIYREYEETQEADYQDFNAAPAETYEQCFDKLTMLCQQQQEQIDRSVKVGMTSGVSPEVVTQQVERIYQSIDNIDIVANSSENVATVAEDINNINTCAEDIESIINAPLQAQNAENSAAAAAQSEDNAQVWAEGTDEQVQALGGEHSSKVWADISSGGGANTDLSNITEAGKEVIRENSGAGFNMFDLVVKDHILSFEESKGFGLQGTYVYKDAVTGSRYGYPDFYNKCIAEKTAGTETQTQLGETTITTYNNSNGHIFYDIADKSTVDTYFESTGEAWFFGIDTTNERIFLPRTTRFQFTSDTSKVGEYQEAGLPNIEGRAGINSKTQSGAFYRISDGLGYAASEGATHSTAFDASASNPIYGNSDTVTPAATNQLLYIVVGNTEVESAATDITDITTTENDTIPLFAPWYFDFEPNSTAWLIAGGQKNNGGLYASTYSTLVQELTNPKYNLKVIDVDDMVADTDYSLYVYFTR